MPVLIKVNEAIALRRRVYFDIRNTDGISIIDTEDGQQPQRSTNGAAWTNSGIGVLHLIGNGRYYADLDQVTVNSVGSRIETRYKGASTVDTPGDCVQVVGFDPTEPLNATGQGNNTVIFTEKDINENPIQFVDIWVTTDEVGSNIIAGVLETNRDGQVTFQLDVGSYYLWRRHQSYSFVNPKYFTVT